MNKPKFFRAIWRVNSLLILAVGLMAFGVLALVGYEFYKEKFRNRQVSEVVNVQPNARINSEWTLGNFERVAGTDYLMAPAYSRQSYQMSYYEKGASAVRNYLFVNALDKTSRWLVPGNSYLFLTAERLSQSNNYSEDHAVKWMKYEVVKSDTNGDGRLTDQDQRAIAISSAVGEGYSELIPSVDQILGSKLQNEDTLLIFYRTVEKSFATEINLPERQVTVTKELPRIQPL